jgi:sulfotransferase family protein
MRRLRSLHKVRKEVIAPDEAATTAPFFIVGAGRSGTTLLRMMLASHSRLSIPPETWYLTPLVERFSLDRPLTGDEIEEAVSIITGHDRWQDLKLDAQEYRREVSRLTDPFLRDVVEVVYRRYQQADGKVRWGEKTPQYINIVPQLLTMYPDARFINIVRDGRDVAKSNQVAGWAGNGWHANTRWWIEAIEWYWRWDRSAARDRILLVHYEDLVLDTETVLRKICRFIGEEFEPQMLSWERVVDKQVPVRERKSQTKLKFKIGEEGVARWKREMSARQTFICEAYMGSSLRRLGYELRYASPLWAPVFSLTRLCYPIAYPGYEFAMRIRGGLKNRFFK